MTFGGKGGFLSCQVPAHFSLSPTARVQPGECGHFAHVGGCEATLGVWGLHETIHCLTLP